MSKECLECKETFRGRADKKFCSDICRNSYNNRLNGDSNNYVRNVNNILRRNRRVLENLMPVATAKTSKSKLSQKGFDFEYHTHVHTTKKGSSYYFCYEYGYLPLGNDNYCLVKRKEYSEHL